MKSLELAGYAAAVLIVAATAFFAGAWVRAEHDSARISGMLKNEAAAKYGHSKCEFELDLCWQVVERSCGGKLAGAD